MTFDIAQFIFNMSITLLVALLYLRIREIEKAPSLMEEVSEELEQIHKLIERENLAFGQLEASINIVRERVRVLEKLAIEEEKK